MPKCRLAESISAGQAAKVVGEELEDKEGKASRAVEEDLSIAR
jgi:uncharacterized protein YoaH (UPF0181 family)